MKKCPCQNACGLLKPIPAAVDPPCSTECKLELDGRESFLFDLWATEHVGIAGTTIEFWSLDLASSKRDPLYDEPTQRSWNGPYKIKAFASNPTGVTSTGEEGLRARWDASVWISRKELEQAGASSPSPGDILRIWDLPWINDDAVNGEAIPCAGFYFDVTEVEPEGRLFDNAMFVGFTLSIVRRTEFTPERRLRDVP